jgi:hypothetical protein
MYGSVAMKEALCQYQDAACRERVRQVLLARPFKLIKHWQEPGIEIWTYKLDSETLKVSEEYGEMYVDGSEHLKNWLISEVQKRAGRLRYSLVEAQAEATRLAEALIADQPGRDQLRHQGTFPDTTVPLSRRSKHPVAWIAVFTPVLAGASTLDGGELLVAVDLERGLATIREP